MRNLFSMLGGLVAGAALGLLFAPYSGKETRDKLEAMVKEKMPNLSAERLEAIVDEILAKIKGEEKVVEAD
ncbi:MAG: YtxH domain-containing protein [Paludibacteraceae bacterium]|nr:YtxH domain-containing protein [Paludibacteraceae bacterium]